jgi:hypothetical protein
MRIVYVLPPSNDNQSSISQYDGQLVEFGLDVLHSTLTVCPVYTTCPAVGEISWAEYGGGGAGMPNIQAGMKVNATKNRVRMNPRVFIL